MTKIEMYVKKYRGNCNMSLSGLWTVGHGFTCKEKLTRSVVEL